MQIGIISDTHDLLRPEVLKNLQGCDWILHGGDISSRKILDQLEALGIVDGDTVQMYGLRFDYYK